jgi:hypothetical protein
MFCRWKHSLVHFVPYEGKMIKMTVERPKTATIKDLKDLVGSRVNVPSSKVFSSLIILI